MAGGCPDVIGIPNGGWQVAPSVRNWLLRQLNAKDSLDGIVVTVKLAIIELGTKTVAKELRRLADCLERTGHLPGWNFPVIAGNPLKHRTRQMPQVNVEARRCSMPWQ